MTQPIRSGFASFDAFIGGGFQPGYPWLLVAGREAEGTAVTVANVLSWRFVKQGIPTLIITTRHPWGISLERYKHSMPEISRNLELAEKERRLMVVNLAGTVGYTPVKDYELCFEGTDYPTQIYNETTRGLEKLKTSGRPVFWRFTSLSDLTTDWGSARVVDILKRLLPWLHEHGATGVATINREIAARAMLDQAMSLFPNVAYVGTTLGTKVKYDIQVVKAYNPKTSSKKRELKVTPKYEIVIA